MKRKRSEPFHSGYLRELVNIHLVDDLSNIVVEYLGRYSMCLECRKSSFGNSTFYIVAPFMAKKNLCENCHGNPYLDFSVHYLQWMLPEWSPLREVLGLDTHWLFENFSTESDMVPDRIACQVFWHARFGLEPSMERVVGVMKPVLRSLAQAQNRIYINENSLFDFRFSMENGRMKMYLPEDVQYMSCPILIDLGRPGFYPGSAQWDAEQKDIAFWNELVEMMNDDDDAGYDGV